MKPETVNETDLATFAGWRRKYYADIRVGFFNHRPHPESAPRILFVDHDVGDFKLHRMALARSLIEAGFDVQVAVPQGPGFETISSIPVHLYYLQRLSIRPQDELRCLISLLRLYRRLRPTLVYHIGLKPVLHGGLAARFTSVPAAVNVFTGLGHLFTTHNVRLNIIRSIVAAGLRLSFSHRNQRVIVQNGDTLDRLLDCGIDPGECAVLIKGSGVDLTLFKPTPEPCEPIVILMASRLLWEKGVGEFVAAARALRARGIAARFVLLGEPDYGHPSAVPLETLEHWRDCGDIEWLGWQQDMPAFLSQCHIVCLPSYYGEGVPRILIEAAASGRSIITTNSPGCREVVRHGQNGLLIPVRDCEALIAAILRLIDNPPLRATMGAHGREIAVAEFDLENVIGANLTICRSLLGLLQFAPGSQ
ncbi:MAG: glycosyltransferase family 4 protein [Acidobacteriota bacterium]|nr:MAG: glycosyltransferase family 4 protein [Acidobacteriota bacterium]